jgi:hypothetical protein
MLFILNVRTNVRANVITNVRANVGANVRANVGANVARLHCRSFRRILAERTAPPCSLNAFLWWPMPMPCHAHGRDMPLLSASPFPPLMWGKGFSLYIPEGFLSASPLPPLMWGKGYSLYTLEGFLCSSLFPLSSLLLFILCWALSSS